ncbi:triple functional domain protein-like [Corythoichthys intestinalis]|uniref:triple functional domain protein-like n=1 Tax=Corythoichthys intestinalis TaxID=161448 RepID=UPI0025A5FC73|nr:triple functional domain protein-like [Corythoichthys intestinalis]
MEDWCGATDEPGFSGQMDQMTSMIRKHLKQKEFFLKACTLTKEIAYIFHQFVERNGATVGRLSQDQEQHVTSILNDLCQRENRVLSLWNVRKQDLDQCLRMEKHRCSLRKDVHLGIVTATSDMMPRSCRTLKRGHKLDFKGTGPTWQKWLSKCVSWPNHKYIGQ